MGVKLQTWPKQQPDMHTTVYLRGCVGNGEGSIVSQGDEHVQSLMQLQNKSINIQDWRKVGHEAYVCQLASIEQAGDCELHIAQAWKQASVSRAQISFANHYSELY